MRKSGICIKIFTMRWKAMNEHEKKILAIVSKYMQKDVQLFDSIDELGVDSLVFIQILVDIESELNFQFKDEALDRSKYHLIKDIANEVIESIN